jgi:deazaflavin-dependent oxidoreductase (nitroreductase family)
MLRFRHTVDGPTARIVTVVIEEYPMTQAPALVRALNPLARRLLRLGLRMGPNVLLTVRGRSSGLPRSAPVAVAEIDGRRYVVGAYGDVAWVRNLRAAREAEIQKHGQVEHVQAVELGPAAATDFFGRLLPGYLHRLPRLGRGLIRALFRLAAPDILGDPARAAANRPVFELRVAR